MKLPTDIRAIDAFLAIVRDLPDLYVFAKDRAGRFLLCNPALLKAIGLSSEGEILGRTDFDFFERGLAARYRQEDAKVMRSGEPVTNQVWFVPGPGGVLRWYVSSKYPLLGEDGEVAGVIGAMRDVSKTGQVLGPYQEMEPVLKEMSRRFAKSLTVAELAGLVHLSVSQFERRFKALFGLSPMQYLKRVRLDNAARMLTETAQAIAIIALDCGFYDHSHFGKAFRQAFGQSPREFRRQSK